ncbi:MAG: 4-(cytidine 5'-diphospho)-2-C-methyl-D-erythritol kinase [Candidatus Dasytiphilus stammeri]
MNSITCWPAPAKLNLFLYINGRYPNGYHHLQTLYQFLDYGDLLLIRINNSGSIDVYPEYIDHIKIENNLIIKAANLLRHKARKERRLLPLNAGAEIELVKNLPIGGGLGGGSSDAATTLLALNYLWKTKFSIDDLTILGLELGIDVPLFIKGYAALAEGLGNQLHKVQIPEKWYVIIDPGLIIYTAQVFGDPELKRNTTYRNLRNLLHTKPFTNDCELIVRKRFPELEKIFSWLLKYTHPRLTGTGSCIFGEFDSELSASQVLNQAPPGIQGFVSKGLNISPLHKFLYL